MSAIGMYPIDSITAFDSALCILRVFAILHGPFPLYAAFLALPSLSPSAIRRLHRVRGFFHCRQMVPLILRKSNESEAEICLHSIAVSPLSFPYASKELFVRWRPLLEAQ